MSKPTLYSLTHYSTPWLLCIVQYSTVQYPKRVQQMANVMKSLDSKYLVNSCLMHERRFEYWIYITCSKVRSYHCRQCSVQMSNKEVLSFIKSILQSESKLQYTKYKFFKNKDERGIFGAMHWLFRTIKLSPAPPSLLTSSRDICVKSSFFFSQKEEKCWQGKIYHFVNFFWQITVFLSIQFHGGSIAQEVQYYNYLLQY